MVDDDDDDNGNDDDDGGRVVNDRVNDEKRLHISLIIVSAKSMTD